MLRPLAFDIAMLLIPIAVGAGAFLLGRSIYRGATFLRIGAVAVVVAIVIAGVFAFFSLLPAQVEPVVSRIGGATIILCWSALFLMGVVWKAPRRSFSTSFLSAIAGIAGILIVIESAGALWWRFGDTDAWRRTANAEGALQQSSGATCSPAAAVMLLGKFGISSSEGEMAYLSGTSLFGTDDYAIARALDRKVEPLGWHAEALRTDYETCLRRRIPFLAHVRGFSSGHALLVEGMNPEFVLVLDPADGKRKKIARSDFESAWNNTAVYVLRPGD
jgi:hypothetical protein